MGKVDADLETLIERTNNMKQYKVLSQNDNWWTGKFKPDLLENALNSHAQHGWKVVAATTASIPGIFGQRDEMVIVMEREIQSEAAEASRMRKVAEVAEKSFAAVPSTPRLIAPASAPGKSLIRKASDGEAEAAPYKL